MTAARRDAGVLTPSQLAGRSASRTRVRISGRVVYSEGSTLVVADALASATVKLRHPIALETLAQVQLSARRSAGGWVDGELHATTQTAAGAAEFERLWGFGVGRALQARARAETVVHEYFTAQQFLCVHTPVLVPAPGTDVYIDPIAATGGYLNPSPEFQMKRLLAGGIPRIYQFAHAFRGDESGQRHEREFTLLEWYRAHQGYDAVMRDTEQVVARVLKAVSAKRRVELDGRSIDCTPPFKRVTVQQAFARHAGVRDVSALAERDEDRYFQLLVERVEPALARSSKPVFLIDYPLSQAALARPCPRRPRYAERFELYLGGVELCNGYGELTCASQQRERFERDNVRRAQLGKTQMPLDEKLLMALQQGLPPCAGNALGFDRLLMLALAAPTLDRVMAFGAAQL